MHMRSTHSPAHAIAARRRKRSVLALLLAGLAVGLPGPAAARSHAPLPETASREYQLDAGDEIRVAVMGLPALSGAYVVGDDGMIAVPLLESIAVRGKSTGQLQQA